MYIKSLELKNYRNYNDLSIEFEKGTNILYGNNAQGKTIYLKQYMLLVLPSLIEEARIERL